MAKKRILVIDDDSGMTQLLKLKLEGTGRYEVHEENSGARGLATARAFRPDLILLDVLMPDMDGSEVVSKIKTDERLQATPIVFLTAVVSKKETSELSNLMGGMPCVAKPVSTEALIQCIEKCLGK